ncbi:MAG: P-loop NTPase [Deltaproteobacteria bacterium]|nr:P-loop NTPase [Deltaproteobacteria bacterium]
MNGANPPTCFFRQRLLFVAGKGGVGKTAVAAGLALALAERHARVALVELGPDVIAPRFGRDPAGYAGVGLTPRCTVMNLTPRLAFQEYVTRELHSRKLYSLLLDNRFVHYFLDATPGINALLCLGKIWWMLTHEAWDCCVVDLPATGHGVGMLDVPRVVQDAVHLGPLKQLGQDLQALLTDAATTSVVPVTHLEAMPVTEMEEMLTRLTGVLRIAWGPVICNAVWPPPVPAAQLAAYARERAALAADRSWATGVAVTDFCLARWRAAEAQRARVAAIAGLRSAGAAAAPAGEAMLEVPYQPAADGATVIRAIADRLKAAI